MYQQVLQFWFEEIPTSKWWTKDPAFDTEIQERFGELHAQAARCECFDWRSSAEGRLAEVIVLDQFSRNMYRDQPAAFAQDPLALALAQEAVAQGHDQKLTATQRGFLYMPYMHSESLKIHDEAVRLFEGLNNNQLDFEHRHREIIVRFGRYPHRNTILGRVSTPEELEFLKQPGSSF